MENKTKKRSLLPNGCLCVLIVVALFGYLGYVMGVPNMLNTIMKTAHDLLINTVFYLMSICVITGALGRVFVEFGVVSLLEKLLRPLMKPVFNLPGVSSLGAVMTFLSDNPAIISLANDKRFASFFKKYQYISLTNFGTAFGMGLLVMVFMVGNGFYAAPFIGLFGACCGCVCSTRLMQRFILKAFPQYAHENAVEIEEEEMTAEESDKPKKSVFIRLLDGLLDGGRSGVDVEKVEELIRKLDEDDPSAHIRDRLTCFVQPQNGGKREALARGLTLAKHELLVFVDSDSFLSPFAVRNVVQPFKDKEMGGVCCLTLRMILIAI